MLLPLSNSIFVPASGTDHFNLRAIQAGPRFYPTGLGYILETANFRTRWPQSENACGFLRSLFEMFVEITTVLFLVQGISMLSRLIESRRDVLYYVSKPDDPPRW
jgi:hypothetical protein